MDAKFFPRRLRELRESARMTQSALAAMLGYKQAGVSKWEMGENQPSHEELLALCAIFNVTPNDMFTEPRSVPARRGRGRPKKQVNSAPPSGGSDGKKRGRGRRGAGGS
jgi:transcriptional regulator with XRE-family HTH domain